MPNNNLVLWILGGTGVFLLVSAYRNVTPQSLIKSSIGAGSTTPIVGAGTAGVGLASITTSTPATPDATTASNIIGNASGAHLQNDSGIWDAYDANGNNLGPIPSAYQKQPNLYTIPAAKATGVTYA